jgi:hypothetical protein
VADHAIGGASEIFAVFDLIGIDKILGNAGRIGRVVIGERNRPAAGGPLVKVFRVNTAAAIRTMRTTIRMRARMTLTP